MRRRGAHHLCSEANECRGTAVHRHLHKVWLDTKDGVVKSVCNYAFEKGSDCGDGGSDVD